MIDFMIILGIILIILLVVIISKKCRKKEGFKSINIPSSSPLLLPKIEENCYVQIIHPDDSNKTIFINGKWNNINNKTYILDTNLIGSDLIDFEHVKNNNKASHQGCARRYIHQWIEKTGKYKSYSDEQVYLMKLRTGSLNKKLEGASDYKCFKRGEITKDNAELKCLQDNQCTSYTLDTTRDKDNSDPKCLKRHEVLTFNHLYAKKHGHYKNTECRKKPRRKINDAIKAHQKIDMLNYITLKNENLKFTTFENTENVPTITWPDYGQSYYFLPVQNSKTKYTIKSTENKRLVNMPIQNEEKINGEYDENQKSEIYLQDYKYPESNDYRFELKITKINPEIINIIINIPDNKVSIDVSKIKINGHDKHSLQPYTGKKSFFGITNIYRTDEGQIICFVDRRYKDDKYIIIKLNGEQGKELQYFQEKDKFKGFININFKDTKESIFQNENNLFTLKYNDNNNKIKELKNQNLTPPFFNRTDYGLKEGESYIINIGVNITGFTNIDGKGYYRLYKKPKLDEKYKFVKEKLKKDHSLYYLKENGKEIYHPIGLLKDGNKYIIYDFSYLKDSYKLKYLTKIDGSYIFDDFKDYSIDSVDSSFKQIHTFNLSYVEMTGKYITQNLYIIGKNIKISDLFQNKYNNYEKLFQILYPEGKLYEISNNSSKDMDDKSMTYEDLYAEIKKINISQYRRNINTIMLYIYIQYFKNYDGIKKLYISKKQKDLFKNDYYDLTTKNKYILVKNTTNLNHFDFDKIGENKLKSILLKNTNYNCHKNLNNTYCFYTLDTNYHFKFLNHDLSSTETKTEFNIKVIETTSYSDSTLGEYGILKKFKEQEITNNVGITIKRGGYYLRLIDNSFDFTDCMNVNDKKPLKVTKEENPNMDSKYVIKSDNQIWKNENGQIYYFLDNKIYNIINYIPILIPDLTIEYKSGIVAKRDDNCAKVVQYEDKSISINSSDDMEDFTNTKDKNIQFLIKNKKKNEYLTYTNESKGIKHPISFIQKEFLKTKTYYEDGEFQKTQSSIFYIGDNGDTFCYLSKIENLENRKINLHNIIPKPSEHIIKDYKNIINTKRIKHTIGKLIGDNEDGYIIKMDDEFVNGVFELVPIDETFNLEKNELKLYEEEHTKIIDIDKKLDIQIKQLKEDITKLNNNVNQTIQKINTKITKIDKLLTKYEVHAKKTINQKLKDILVIIYNNYKIELAIILLRQSYQAKFQFSVNISTDEEYVQILKNEINDAKFEIKRLELQIKEKNLKNYVNLQETNQIIGKVNDMIDIIQEKLDSLETKEKFNNFTYHNKKHTDFNNIYDDISEKINSININIITNNTLYDNKIKLEENLKNLETYDKLLETKTTNLETNYRTMFNKFDQELYNLKNKLYSKNTNKEDIFKVLQRKSDISKITSNIKFNHIEKDSLELELMNLQDQINSLNVNIKGVNLINRAGNQLNELKKINLHIIKYRLMNTRAYGGFQNGSINTVKDIINRNNFGLSKTQEDNLNDFRTTQSLYNNENISIQPIQEDNTFKIHINNKCLEVRGDKNYSLKECNKVTPTQYFEAIKIRNKSEAIETNKIIPSNEKIKYPFYQMVSSISGNCLSLDDHGISVIPCNTNSIQQHWKMKTHEKLCLDN